MAQSNFPEYILPKLSAAMILVVNRLLAELESRNIKFVKTMESVAMTSIGIIGAGMIANVHAEAAVAVGTEVVAVYDPREKSAKAFGEKHNCEVD